jgi:nicotinate-nucleotide pyrophosphorylase (carboxylating)
VKLPPEAREVIRRALEEDQAGKDITSRAVVPPDLRARARLVSREAGVASGLALARLVFPALDRRCQVRVVVRDGGAIRPGRLLAEIRGPARALLAGERTYLNLAARLCGIATLTRSFVRAAGKRIRILDTRKTTPGLRALEKYAVRCGGGTSHRAHLGSAILIKDNHIALAGDLATAVLRARAGKPGWPVEVEAGSLGQVREALWTGAEAVLLDNMKPAMAARALRIIGRKAVTEISGGVTLSNIRAYAALGPDRISIGALTHSAPALDLSLDLG